MTELSALQKWMQETITHPAGINPEGVAGRIVWAWILTIPMSAAIPCQI